MNQIYKPGKLLGYYSSILTAIILLWFPIAFGLYQPIVHTPWHDMKSYNASFRPVPFLAWIIPCFLLTICFLTMITCLHTLTLIFPNKSPGGQMSFVGFAFLPGVLFSEVAYNTKSILVVSICHILFDFAGLGGRIYIT